MPPGVASCVVLGSGLVYTRPTTGTPVVFDEDVDEPNNFSSVYSRARIDLERYVPLYASSTLLLRLLFPCSLDGSASCFVEKMTTRSNSVHDTDVSVTVLSSLLPLFADLCENPRARGIVHFVNRGTISLKRLLEIDGRVKSTDIHVVDHCVTRGNVHLGTRKLESLLTSGAVEDVETALYRRSVTCRSILS